MAKDKSNSRRYKIKISNPLKPFKYNRLRGKKLVKSYKMETRGVEPLSKTDFNKSLRVYLLIGSIDSGKQLKPYKSILGFI